MCSASPVRQNSGVPEPERTRSTVILEHTHIWCKLGVTLWQPLFFLVCVWKVDDVCMAVCLSSPFKYYFFKKHSYHHHHIIINRTLNMRYFHKNVRVSGSSSNLIVSVICRCSVRDYYLNAEVNGGITKVREDLTLHRSCSGNSVCYQAHPSHKPPADRNRSKNFIG